MYAITGITGQVGGAVARTLLAAGAPVRAVVRDAAKGAVWAERGCEIARAEMTDVPALTAAFAGARGVFVLIPPIFDPEPGNPEIMTIFAALAKALVAAKPGRVVALSTIGAQASRPSLLLWLGIMERQFSTLPMPAAFLRAGWFMENAAWDVVSARDAGVIESFLHPLDKTFPMVATEDVGRVAAKMLQENWAGSRVVELEGPRRVSPNDVAGAFSRIFGRRVIAETMPRDKWETLFAARGAKNPTPRIQMLDGFNQGWIAFESPEAQTLKGAVELEAVLRELVARAG